MYENEIRPQRAMLVSLDTGEYDAEISLAELEELTRTAGAEPALTLTQKRPAPETATCIGSGMVEQVAELCAQQEIDLLIFDRELTPTQIRNLEKACGVRVIDRTTLILDIFAQRARSKEGKLQVELAQLRYLLPRLSGQGTALSRLGGGIGTRGPGETKLETDRRHIRRRIGSLREQLRDVEAAREVIDRRRKKDGTVTVALVGYTNAGKSTLMNQLTQAGVLAEDKLFATLDPTARALKLPCGKTVMLIDTVGMSTLFLPDLQYHFHGMDPNWVVNHAYNAASYILEHDNPIEDGETIDGVADGQMCREIQWKCQYEDALIQPPRGVLDINMGNYASGGR